MRALVVAGAPEPGVADIVSHLAPGHDVVIAADAGASACLSAGVIPDLVVGDLDSLPAADLRRLDSLGVPVLRVSTEKDATDLDLALEQARARGADALTVTGVLGGRLDHSLAALGSLANVANLSPLVVEPGLRGWLLASEQGARGTLELESSVGAIVSIIALTGSVVSCTGLRYPLASRALPALSSLGISNVVESDAARVSAEQGLLLVLLIPEHE